MRRGSTYFDKLNETITKLCELIIVIVFMVMGSAILIQIVLRTLGQSMIAMEDIALFGFFWLVFLGAAVAFKEGIHVKVEFFVNWLPAGVRGMIITAANLIVLIFMILFTWSGVLFTINNVQQHAMQLRISMAYVYFILPVSGFVAIIIIIGKLKPDSTSPPENQQETREPIKR
jgi:TRAP-type C4-dicarboxylate transport system permease small subunit